MKAGFPDAITAVPSQARTLTQSFPDRRTVVRSIGGLVLAAAGNLGGTGAARARALDKRLARGVNLSHWFAQSLNGYGAEHLKSFVTAEDLSRLAAAGFGHVRLGVEPDALFATADDPTRFAEPVLAQLRVALASIAQAGLAVVLDLHPVGASKKVLLTPNGAETFVRRWSKLAAAVGRETRGGLVLEILNEPDPLAGAAWWTLQGRALAAIRSAGADGPVIANGGGWSGIADLVARTPYDDGNVVYTVHCYGPILFTHQAANWTWDVAQSIAGLGWPIAPGEAERATNAATADPRARGFLRDQIAGGRFTAETLEADYETLAKWQRTHGDVPIYVGEFGVYAKAAPAEARLAWVRVARAAFERRGWGWALWDNSASFGLRRAGANGRDLDPAMLEALGVTGS